MHTFKEHSCWLSITQYNYRLTIWLLPQQCSLLPLDGKCLCATRDQTRSLTHARQVLHRWSTPQSYRDMWICCPVASRTSGWRACSYPGNFPSRAEVQEATHNCRTVHVLFVTSAVLGLCSWHGWAHSQEGEVDPSSEGEGRRWIFLNNSSIYHSITTRRGAC